MDVCQFSLFDVEQIGRRKHTDTIMAQTEDNTNKRTNTKTMQIIINQFASVMRSIDSFQFACAAQNGMWAYGLN